MNLTMPNAPQPGAPSENAVVRFLRWLIERPNTSQPREMLVLRWVFRAAAFLLGAFVAGEMDLGQDNGGGMGGVAPKKSGFAKPPER